MGRAGMALFRGLLYLYPATVRRRDGQAQLEMLECRLTAGGGLGTIGVVVREAIGLARAGLAARFGRQADALGNGRRPAPGRARLLAGVAQDLRFALRSLRRDPSFTAVAVLTLALGIGINVAIFSVVNAVLLRPLPYPDAERLVSIRIQRSASKAIQDGIAAARSLDAVVAQTTWGFTIIDVDEPQVASGGLVTANFFDVFGGTPLLGRTFAPTDAATGSNDVAILTESLWRSHYGSDPEIVGRRVDIANDHHPSRVVIGVMPAGAPRLGDWQLWVPLRVDPADEDDYYNSYYLNMIGRLTPGTSATAAHEELDALLAGMADNDRMGLIPSETSAALAVRGLHEVSVGSVRSMLLLLLGAVVSVLLIACTNVANLLLARSGSRAGELAVRSALGAGRARLARQLVTESALLGVLAGVVGTLAAAATLDLLRGRLPAVLPLFEDVALDGPVAAYAIAVSAGAALAFGLVPALRASSGNVAPTLREGGPRSGAGPKQRRVAAALVVGEVALASLLVVTAGLLVRSLVNLQAAPAGFDPAEVVTLRVTAPASIYDQAGQRRFWSQLEERLRGAPGVRAVGAIHLLPLQPGNWSFPILPEGFAPDPDASLPDANFRVVTPGYFDAMGIELIAGRDFDTRDHADAAGVAIVNRTLAERFWPGATALDREVKLFGSIALRVVGVVGDVRQHRLDREGRMELYQPHAQWPLASMVVAAQAERPRLAIPAIQQAIRDLDSRVPVHDVAPMGDVVASSLGQPRLAAGLLGGFALLALALGTIGVYGVLSYTVSQRTREIGIRMALGSRSGGVVRDVITDGMRPVLAGLALGLGGAWLAGRWLEGMLFEVDTADPTTYVVVALVLVAAGLAAGYLPARRAAGVDPILALRGD